MRSLRSAKIIGEVFRYAKLCVRFSLLSISLQLVTLELVNFLAKLLVGYDLSGKVIIKVFDGIRLRYRSGQATELIHVNKDYEKMPDYVPRQGDVVVDCGAFVGLYASRVARMIGSSGLLISLEPNPVNFKYLLESIRMSNCTNVLPIQVALSDFEGLSRLTVDDDRLPSSTGTLEAQRYVSRPAKGPSKTFNCKTTTLDSLVSQLEIDHVDLVKVDVEGAEYSVLKGAINLLRKRAVSRWIVEIHSLAEFNLPMIILLLKTNGYLIDAYSEGFLFAKSFDGQRCG